MFETFTESPWTELLQAISALWDCNSLQYFARGMMERSNRVSKVTSTGFINDPREFKDEQ